MELSETEIRILKKVEEEVRTTPKLIAEELGLNPQHIRNLMASLAKFGFLKRITRGLYVITSPKSEIIRQLGSKAKSIYLKVDKK